MERGIKLASARLPPCAPKPADNQVMERNHARVARNDDVIATGLAMTIGECLSSD